MAKIHSKSNKAKKIIRDEMLSYFPAREYGTRSRLDAMKKDADAGNAGLGYPSGKNRKNASNYDKAAHLVDSASLAIWDQDRMLGKIYGKDNVKNWSNNKKHETYKHLVTREYSAMIEERERYRKNRK